MKTMDDIELEKKCANCNVALKGEVVKCSGVCEKIYHAKCAGFTTNSLKFFVESKNLIFRCDECIIKPDIMMGETIKKILSFMCMFDERLHRQEKSNEFMCKQIECVNENLKHISEQVKYGYETNGKDDRQNESYASVTKNMYDETVVIKPKKNQGSDITRSVMREKLSIPQSLSISSVKNIPKGGVVINCNSRADLKIIQSEANKKLGEEYSVIVPTKRNPKIKILNISEKLSENEVIENIKSQNEFMKESNIKVIKIYENNKRKNYGVVAEIDPTSFNKVIKEKKLRIGWNICNVIECINVKRCYNCCGFNHIAKNCKNKKACLKCGGEHNIDECKSEREECINCKSAVNRLKIKIDTNHSALSQECATYKRKLEGERKFILYKD